MGGYPRGCGNHTLILVIALFHRAFVTLVSHESLLLLILISTLIFTLPITAQRRLHIDASLIVSRPHSLPRADACDAHPVAASLPRSPRSGPRHRAPAGAMSPPALLPMPLLAFGERRFARGGISGGVGELSSGVAASWWSGPRAFARIVPHGALR